MLYQLFNTMDSHDQFALTTIWYLHTKKGRNTQHASGTVLAELPCVTKCRLHVTKVCKNVNFWLHTELVT